MIDTDSPAWARFAAEIADIAGVNPDEVHPDSLLSGSLLFDSLAAAEIAVFAADEYHFDLLLDPPQENWDKWSAGRLFEACQQHSARTLHGRADAPVDAGELP